MNRIAQITPDFVYVNTADSEERAQRVYARIFRQAWKNLIDKQSIQKYSEK